MLNLFAVGLALGLGTGEIPKTIAREAQKAAKCIVRLNITFTRDERAIPSRDKPTHEKMVDIYYDQKMSLRWHGIRIDPEGTVVCADPCLPLWRIARVEGEYENGDKADFELHAIFLDYSALLFKPKEKPGAPLPRVRFSKPRFEFGDRFYRVQLVLVSRDWHLQIVPERADTLPLGPSSAYKAYFGLTTQLSTPFGGCLLLDRRGRITGFQVEYDLWDGPEGLTTYHPRALREGRRLTRTEWEETCRRLGARVQERARKVEIFLRNVKDDDEVHAWQASPQQGDRAISAYGIPVPGGRFLVPVDLEREVVRQITRIRVHDADGGAREVPFAGVLAKWGALLVGGAEEATPFAVRRDAAPIRGQLFLVHRLEERFGRMYQETDYNRFFNFRYGYRDEEIVYPIKDTQKSALLFDLDGELLGFHLVRKSQDRPGDRRSWEQVVSMRDIAEELLAPDKAYDPLARPKPTKEQKRPVWLGVEFQGLNRPLMEIMGLLRPTREGEVGLMVSRVYRGSPAEELGIEPGDVLLRVREKGKTRPTEFVHGGRRAWGGGFYLSRGLAGGSAGPIPYRIWRPRYNYLTNLLTKIGPGKNVTLTWLHGGKEKEADVVLEESPDDFDSADKYKDRLLGVTVKDLTYEVRDVLRLAPDAPGVVVSDVERGGKSAVRRVRPFELLTHFDGRPLRKVKDLEAAVGAAKAANRDRVECRLWTFGEARIATIDLAEEEGEAADE